MRTSLLRSSAGPYNEEVFRVELPRVARGPASIRHRHESRVPHAICCQQLFKRYPGRPPVDAVNGIDLTVDEGECFGLLGPNGAGKTTTIEILEGLLPATRGAVEILGRRWGADDDAIRERIGISLQETRLPEKLTVAETLLLFRSFYRRGLPPEAVLRLVSLEEKSAAWVKKLSGGQKQRLAVACALIGAPELLFLDEPTTGLDPQSRRQLWDIIRQFRASGRTILLTTHYMDEAEKLCDRVAIVDHGRIIACGSPRDLIDQLGGEHVIEFTLVQEAAKALSQGLLADLPGLRAAREEDERICLTVAEPHIVLTELVGRLAARGLALGSLVTRHASLEDVFVKLTGRHLSEAEAAA
ncbi:MAG: ABC transporter ATP-binding protein [Pirellulales bacterium]|nr:ABC transporter ATP-binding protein [Pirellulales bacterium]